LLDDADSGEEDDDEEETQEPCLGMPSSFRKDSDDEDGPPPSGNPPSTSPSAGDTAEGDDSDEELPGYDEPPEGMAQQEEGSQGGKNARLEIEPVEDRLLQSVEDEIFGSRLSFGQAEAPTTFPDHCPLHAAAAQLLVLYSGSGCKLAAIPKRIMHLRSCAGDGSASGIPARIVFAMVPKGRQRQNNEPEHDPANNPRDVDGAHAWSLERCHGGCHSKPKR
jgi:hypothetical protein